jgi:hypothetical protein
MGNEGTREKIMRRIGNGATEERHRFEILQLRSGRQRFWTRRSAPAHFTANRPLLTAQKHPFANAFHSPIALDELRFMKEF